MIDTLAEHAGAVNLEEPVSIHDRVEQLFRDARNDVYYYLLSFGLTSAEAQDLAQDAFLRYYTAIRRGDLVENPRGWLFRAAHNLALNAIERRTTRRLFAVSSKPPEADTGEDPEQRLIRKQKQEKIRDALNTLSPKERLCLHLRAEGLKYSEIAETTGVRMSTVSEFLTRAIRKLRKAVHE